MGQETDTRWILMDFSELRRAAAQSHPPGSPFKDETSINHEHLEDRKSGTSHTSWLWPIGLIPGYHNIIQ
jgi:hypothetical protein